MTPLFLLTGATGFVGRQVLRALTERGIDVRVIVREGKQNLLAGVHGIEQVLTTTDLFSENVAWWKEACTGVDTVVHVAWYAEPGKYLQSEINFDCLAGTLSLAKGAAQAGISRFVGVGTCAEYDLSEGSVSVTTPLKPTTPYAAAKAATFTALSQWLPHLNIEFAWCRLFYLYGEGEDARRLVPYLHARIAAGKAAELGSGKQIRDFLDVATAGAMIAETALGTKQGPINICSGVPITVRQIAERVADEYGRRDLLAFGVRQDSAFEPACVVGVRGE